MPDPVYEVLEMTAEERRRYSKVRGPLEAAHRELAALPPGRARAIAMSKLDEAAMWARQAAQTPDARE